MSKNPELFGDDPPAKTYYVQLSEEDKLLPTYTKRKKSSKQPLRGPLRAIYRNRKRIIRRIAQILLLIIVVYFLFNLYTYYYRNRSPFCTTPSCQRTENELLKSIDINIHPCKNFYKFVCGKWPKHHPVPIDSAETSVIQIARDQMMANISAFLSQTNSRNEPSIVHEVRKFYRSCMRTGRSDGVTQFSGIDKVLKEVGLSVFPLLRKPSDDFSWPRTAALSKKLYDKNFFFELDIVADPRNHSFNRILITKPLTTTLFSSLIKLDKKLFNPQYMEEMIQKEDMAELSKNPYYRLIKVAYHFACRAARRKWSLSHENALNSNIIFLIFLSSGIDHITNLYTNDIRHLPKLYSIDALQKMTNTICKHHRKPPIINWKQYLTWMFEGTNVTLDFQNKDKKILISHIDYLKDILRILAISHESTLEFYMWWETVRGLIGYTNSKLNNYEGQYKLKLTGVQNKPRSQFCAEITNNLYGFATAYMILNDNNIKDNIPKVTEMADNIHIQFRKTINNLDWLDDQTKVKAIRKLDSLTKRVGYPKWMEVHEHLNKYYENTSCSESNFLENVSKLKQMQMKWKLMYYRLANDDKSDGWYSKFVLQTNAFYIMEKNSMMIPAGIFKFPFNQLGLESLNYGALGMIIGHEMTHGFDSTGKEFDGAGRLRTWWSEKTKQEFSKRAQCFINEYDRLTKGAIHLKQTANGTVTLNENIADNGGLQLAYYAFKDHLRRNGPEQLLPRLPKYNSEQLFFISFAHNWCEHRSSHASFHESDIHSSYAIRVLGTLKNFPEFADAWKCKAGSPMNPKRTKCQLW